MELSKIQKFLMNLHKFDPKKEDLEYFQMVKDHVNNLEISVRKHDSNMDLAIGQVFLDLLLLCNKDSIDLEKVLKEKLKFGL